MPTCLADAAALGVSVGVEGEQALGAHQVLYFLCIREGVLDVDAIVLLHSVKQAVRLGVQAARVQAARQYAAREVGVKEMQQSRKAAPGRLM